MASESGFSNQKKLGTAQFKTIHNVGGDKFGQSVASKALYEKTAPDYISISDVIGNSGQIEFLNIYYPGHSASINDVLRLNGGLYPNFEFDIISIVDADNFLVLPLLPAIDISGELALIMSWVTNKANADGSQIVTLAPVPLQFVKDSSVVNVNEDTITPANNVFLPVKDIAAQASLTSIDGKFTTLNAKDFSTSAKQDTGNTSLSSIDGKLTTLNAKDFATSAKQDTGNSSLSSIDTKLTSPLTTKISNGTITANIKPLGTALVTADNAIIVNSVIHGLTTGGGGGYVDVKVTPSGALVTESTVTGSVSVSNFPATQPVSGSVSVSNFPATQAVTGTFFQATQPVSATSLPLPSGASTLAEQQTQTTAIGSITETAPATDTASSGLNGRLQRIAQRLTSLIALFPSSIGTKASAASLSVVLASDQVAIGVTPGTSSGTITQIAKAVGVAAVRATVAGTAPSATRKRLLIKPSKNNTGAIFLGSSSVTTAAGLEIIGPDRLEFLLDASDYYLISDTTAQVVEIIEVV